VRPELPPHDPAFVEELHGHRVPDPFRTLEDGDAPAVVRWEQAERDRFHAATEDLPIRGWLRDRLLEMWRIDDEGPPRWVHTGPRRFVRVRRADQDKAAIVVQDADDGPRRVVLDPNAWQETETLAGFWPSPDGALAVYGRARAGDENAELFVLEVDTGRVRADTTAGWRRGGVVWRHDGRGFWYTGRPAPGTVPDGDEHYFHRVFWHTLGTGAEDDGVVLADDAERAHFHAVDLSPCGRWLVHGRFRFHRSAFWLEDLEGEGERVPITTDMEAEYHPLVVEDRIFVLTDWGAPRYRLMVTTTDRPGRAHWREVIPEGEDVLIGAEAIAGWLVLTWRARGATRTAVHDLDGTHRYDLPWPAAGTGSVMGWWHRPEVVARFESFAHPPTTFRVHLGPDEARLERLRASPVPVDTASVVVDPLAFGSRDGTRVTGFLVRRRDTPRDGDRPVLLTGYGGFNLSMDPAFSTVYAAWLETGGAVAVAHLRGGGEYGRGWHEAGRLGHKENVFDDFIAAAEHLVDSGWTRPARLCISGGSNGGLLVAACLVRRPELFGAVRCAVPLTDMVRFHRFGLAAIWTEEYGDPEDPADLARILRWSPYHGVPTGVAFPPTLITGSLNDARTDPVHARKMYAALVAADRGGGPHHLHIQTDSGHHGAVTLESRADQVSRDFAFLLHAVGVEALPVGRGTPNGPETGNRPPM
jgi:prolyl oligopeptidase